MKLITVIAIIFLISSCAHDLSDQNTLKRIVKYAYDEDTYGLPHASYSGWSKAHYNNGQLKRLVQYQDGALHGSYIDWHINETKLLEATYRRGKLHNAITRKPNGTLVDSQIVDGNGVMVSYYDNNTVSSKIPHHNGRRHEQATWWHDNGQTKEITHYRNGQKVGALITWHNNGTKSSEANYQDGYLEGDKIWWYTNGVKSAHVPFKQGQRHGLANWWHKNGVKSYTAHYKEGRLHGLSTGWHENGNTASEMEYKHGRVITALSWKNDGTRTKTQVKNGAGVIINHHENQTKSSQVKYKRGKRHGVATWWNSAGEKIYETTYESGRQIDALSSFSDDVENDQSIILAR